jgi:hypothetical protein
VLGHEGHVLALSVVLEVSVQAVAPRRAHEEQDPTQQSVRSPHHPGQQALAEEAALHILGLEELFQDEQVPGLVVLLGSGLENAVEDSPGQTGVAVQTGERPVGGPLPSLVGNGCEELQNLELRQGTPAAVYEIDRRQQHGGNRITANRGLSKRRLLGTVQLDRRELRRPGPSDVTNDGRIEDSCN